jgi:hypothetical protein
MGLHGAADGQRLFEKLTIVKCFCLMTRVTTDEVVVLEFIIRCFSAAYFPSRLISCKEINDEGTERIAAFKFFKRHFFQMVYHGMPMLNMCLKKLPNTDSANIADSYWR